MRPGAIKALPATAQPPHPIVRFAGVTKSYDGATRVVKDLDLDIARGEFLSLLGPSGSGKTTSLMMLAGFEAPTTGRILLNGRDITVLPPHRRGIGVVFQNYALFPHMSVERNIAYPLAVRGTDGAETATRVRAALEMVGLSGFGGRRPAQLSGGQQQRVALARALVFEPELILLDEPLGALDKQLRERMQAELKQIHERLGVTMVYVTHDQEEALTLSDRIAVFDDGRIRQLAAPLELYERPASPFVAGFVGENNRLDGIVEERRGPHVAVRLADGSRVVATAVGELGPSDAAVLSLRPERLALGRREAVENRFELPVDRTVYLGDAARLVLRFAGGELVAKTAARAELLGLARGQVVSVGWRADDCRAFRAED